MSVDHTVVRFSAPELGGVDAPRFIFERELAFAARLEAFADAGFEPTSELAYRDVHVRAAMERHIAESILEGLRVTPEPAAEEIEVRVNAARIALAQRVGGARAIEDAARAEGLEHREVFRFLQRQARASLYLDRMVTPMLSPSRAELQLVHQAGRTPYSRQPYAEVESRLRRWYVSRRLRLAVAEYFEGARERLVIEILTGAR